MLDWAALRFFLKCRLLGQLLSSSKLLVCFIILSVLFMGLFTCRLDEQASTGPETESSHTGKMSSSMEGTVPPRAASTPTPPPPAPAAPSAADREVSPGILGEGDVAATVFTSPPARTPNKHSKARQNNKIMVVSIKDVTGQWKPFWATLFLFLRQFIL